MKRLSGLYKKIHKNKDLNDDEVDDSSDTEIEESKMASKEAKADQKGDPNKKADTGTATKEAVPEDPIKQALRRATMGSLVCVLFIAILSIIILDEKYLNLNFGGSYAVQISSYWHKLEFVLCYQSLGISWILFNMFYIIVKRIKSGTGDPMEGNSNPGVREAQMIMQNSIEQFLMTAFAQIISISFMDKSLLIKVIPMINILFLIGRITFWLGYPKYRTFGFMCSAVPNTLIINYNLIKFIQSLFF